MPSKIEWTDETWNPVTGCTPISEGCANCYAKRLVETRLARLDRYQNGFDVTVHYDRIVDPAPVHWRKKRNIFVCSIGDLFHWKVPNGVIRSILDIAAKGPHSFFLLTKRPSRMRQALEEWIKLGDRTELAPCSTIPLTFRDRRPPVNLWLGVSAENQHRYDERLQTLLRIPSVHRFVSLEPLLGPIDLALAGTIPKEISSRYRLVGDFIHWVIVGGETGPGARPCDPEWIEDIVRQCRAFDLPVFVKQMGKVWSCSAADLKGADMGRWPEQLRVREWPP